MENPEYRSEKLDINSPWVEGKIHTLSKTIYEHREKNNSFWDYLLEKKPDTYFPLAHDLLEALQKNSKHHVLHIIRDITQNDLGYILLKNYNDRIIDDPIAHTSCLPNSIAPNVEASYRTLKSGLCATALRDTIRDLFEHHHEISHVLWHHAIDNKASGIVFQHNWFYGLRYHNDYVDLPNIASKSDTIMRILDKKTAMDDKIRHKEYFDLKQYLSTEDLRLSDIYPHSHQKIHERYKKAKQSKQAIHLDPYFQQW